ncbi:MAG TPA: fused MFS/spermidine synthase [Noviherbaspirillum sp.]|nr:fused MFS/spermidine synthase [Noviherbaspirillum sp.]
MDVSVFKTRFPEKLIEGTPYRIVDLNGYRYLMMVGDDDSMHSAMPLSAPDVLVVPYTMVMLSVLPLVPNLKDIVLIGLGGGQQAKFIYRRLPETRLVAVEIDPDMVRIARSHFNVPADDDRLSVVVGDGCDYIKNHPRSCDVLLVDGYDQTFNVPNSLVGEEFYRACYRALRPGGVIALNLDRRSDAWRSAHLRMVSSIFSAHMELPVSDCQSVLLLSRDPLDMDYGVLMQRANALEESLELGLPAFIKRFEKARYEATLLENSNR